MKKIDPYSLSKNEQQSNFGFQVGGLQIGTLNDKQKENKQKWDDFKNKLVSDIKSGDPSKVTNSVITVLNVANPAAAIPRAGVLAGMRANVFGLARKLYIGTLNDQEIKDKRVNPDEAKKVRDLLNGKIDYLWSGLGGNTQNLKDAIKVGFDKPIFETEKSQDARLKMQYGFAGKGYDIDHMDLDLATDDDFYYNSEGGTAAAIAAGLGILATILKMVNDAKLAKNPYLGKDPLGTPPPEYSDDLVKKQSLLIEEAAQKKKRLNTIFIVSGISIFVLSIAGMLIWKYKTKK
jgi:hypothetical protein